MGDLSGQMLIIGFNNYRDIFAATVTLRMMVHAALSTFSCFLTKKGKRNKLTHTIMQINGCSYTGGQIKNCQYRCKSPLH